MGIHIFVRGCPTGDKTSYQGKGTIRRGGESWGKDR